jgi:hypothetical protein
MTFAKKMSLLLSLSAAMSLSALAQDAQAKFTLPHDAHIGAAALPAGEYTVTLSFDGVTKAIIVPDKRAGASMIVLPVSTDDYASCKETSVGMAREGSEWSVRSICFAEPQIALYFSAPMEKSSVASAAPAPVAIAGAR